MTASEERQLVVFSLHGEQYALPVAIVREIIRYSPPEATAAASGLVQGLISLRGKVLPVLDISSRLGRDLQIDSATRIIVLDVAGGSLGLIVDAVQGVLRLPAEQIQPTPVPAVHEGLGEQIASVGDRLILLIDADRALGTALPGKDAAAAEDPGDDQATAVKKAVRRRRKAT